MDFRMGMNEVYSPPPGQNPIANIVLVHGLFGGPWKTWAAKVRSPRSALISAKNPASSASSVDSPANPQHIPSKHVFWPESLLPTAAENVKVYSFGYDADVERFMSSAGLNTVHQHGRNLFNELSALRRTQIPTIIVAHSLGGLVVKEALNQAAHSAQEEERDVVSNTRGIIFLGTPHSGSNSASYGRVAYSLTKVFAFQSAKTKLLTALEKNSETLDRISTAFYQTLETYKNLRIASFSEEKQVRFGVFGMQIVRPDSAKIGHARETWGSISEDHRNMAKYTSSRDDGFVKVSRKIKEWMSDVQKDLSSTELKIYEECLNSLDDPAARFRVQEVDPVRHYNKSTFEWLFTDQVPFSQWLRDDRGEFDAIFWITGKPGSGKSTLMRFALEDSRTMSLQPSNSKGNPMAYFFHLRGKSLVQKSLRGMLMEILYQVLEQYPRSFELIRPIFKNLRRLKQDWDIKSLSQAMLHIPHIPPAVPGCRDRITLFVDALDENQNQDDNNSLLDIFESLKATYRGVRAKPDAPVLEICLASRPWPIFGRRLGDDPRVPSFAIHNFTTKDIKGYTQSQLLMSKNMLKSCSERQKAISELSSDIALRAKGVFIWVRMVVDNLRQDITDGTPIDSLRGILHEYPEELDDMYKFTLNRIRGAYWPETMIVFKAMVASRVPLTVLQLYTVTHICMGSLQSYHESTEPSDDILSWLASRSGGLIELVGTDAEERVSAASGGAAEKPLKDLASGVSMGLNPHAELLHQTVQEFVRNSLDETLLAEIAKKKSDVAGLGGSRLLALACLDRHPPHPHLRNIAKDIFSYIREVEREEDGARSQQMTYLPHWDSFDLHEFPFRVRDSTRPSGFTFPVSEEFSYYMNRDQALAIKILDEGEPGGRISEDMKPFVVAILHDLYYTRGPEHLLKLAPESRQTVQRLLLFIASVGYRLSNDRVDRPRMFHHILTSYVTPLRNTAPAEEHLSYKVFRPPFSPINEHFDYASLTIKGGNLASIIACLKPSTELDDDTLLGFAESLDGEGYEDTLWVKVPGTRKLRSQWALNSKERGDMVEMTLAAFCSRFRDTNRSKWVDLFWDGQDGIPQGLRPSSISTLPFVDLAAWDAVGREPPRRVYTTLADKGGFVYHAIASTGMQAAIVGAGSSRIFRALYPNPVGFGNFSDLLL
ncbi:hypothetical protein FJTKL_02347 [Diaporthe vaccinii]|uniref:Nephrocystin 3-like N-terminal domain-containing protein n=1 Tax=Diaporthe vaccinii TaxID=105482 RepID=A0ABR4F487_9PEZI